jgi:hypothetical protein
MKRTIISGYSDHYTIFSDYQSAKNYAEPGVEDAQDTLEAGDQVEDGTQIYIHDCEMNGIWTLTAGDTDDIFHETIFGE